MALQQGLDLAEDRLPVLADHESGAVSGVSPSSRASNSTDLRMLTHGSRESLRRRSRDAQG
ncbi:hypothetical protein CIK73_09640 [Brachybacterium alimentarium]|uniref:hypothetical protein n=1 Tax=Brachybacterium alimentarium TaxID=47845 RepID=UPI000DF412B6|nr:hypothetical protein [Brachybacterium alimentarium]RCS67814.1 hypothetical protein CIK73_09640 [Brachybacterium alimentarium]